ncbi:MAG: BamA/TamA family outer membrane protein [Saprospiraceae bacterium]|nr:BamA/TamA family outer membrane protein [Saprospiraceae bacterium]
MRFFRITHYILVFLFINAVTTTAQEAIYVDTISVEGNKKTSTSIILRELHFKLGDTIFIADLEWILEESEQLVMNTGLFNKTTISFKNWEGATNKVHIHIEVEEAWYIYPVPIFELADRNFNVWWVEQGRSLQRINFGVEFTHINFTGQKDKLKLTAKYGYTRSYSLRYSLPYINKAQTLGINFNISYSRNREINYLTLGNKQAFYRDEDRFIRKRFWAITGLSFRPGLRATHLFKASFIQNTIDNVVAKDLNPDYFIDGRSLQRFFKLSYRFAYDYRDIRPYPEKGYYIEAEIEKDGLGIFNDRNALTLQARYDAYIPISNRWTTSLKTRGKYSFIRKKQPYNDNRAIGFGQHVIHGFELYIIDGLDMVYTQSSIRFKFFENKINFGKLMPIKAFRNMPFKTYLTFNNDVGFVNAPFTTENNQNILENTLLWGGGIGLDIVLFYDKVISIEYSHNHLWESGLFLHLNLNI